MVKVECVHESKMVKVGDPPETLPRDYVSLTQNTALTPFPRREICRARPIVRPLSATSVGHPRQQTHVPSTWYIHCAVSQPCGRSA